jgi:hypothetical protein
MKKVWVTMSEGTHQSVSQIAKGKYRTVPRQILLLLEEKLEELGYPTEGLDKEKAEQK